MLPPSSRNYKTSRPQSIYSTPSASYLRRHCSYKTLPVHHSGQWTIYPKYRMHIGDDATMRLYWHKRPIQQYTQLADRHPTTGRLYSHVAILRQEEHIKMVLALMESHVDVKGLDVARCVAPMDRNVERQADSLYKHADLAIFICELLSGALTDNGRILEIRSSA
ncbi:hypothetical protein FLAG1_08388 [Fusarium langsethiae]|uniref:Uncharacterized protein n=1 Tax=Fusarium langsethiae TaxID=179993 RepID=A0A0N0DCW0_FUSLA|nr:hypothetical protein FLAG1_08388 [Fusarium langsethiae]